MAIDDNTVYGLTGAQIKELPEKIEAVKGLAKELTTDDYNYPDNNPTEFVAGRAEPGIYSASGVFSGATPTSATDQAKIYIVTPLHQGSRTVLVVGPHTDLSVYVTNAAGEPVLPRQDISYKQDVKDDLTSTSTNTPLSANQGRVLKNLIDAIVVPTKTSDLTNDSSFVTSTEMTTALASKADANAVPTALSDLTNDINAVSDSNYVHTDNNYTTVEKTKLAGIASGAEANVQSDWSQTDTTADDYIKNKPTLPDVSGKLDNTTTFWGQTASNGAVDGEITITGNPGYPNMVLGNGHVSLSNTGTFHLRAMGANSTYSNVLWWSSTSSSARVPSNVQLAAYQNKMTLKPGELALSGNGASGIKISGVMGPQSSSDAATKGYVDTAISAVEGMTELSTSDYNYPVDAPTKIVASLLDTGFYYNGDSSLDVQLLPTSTASDTRGMFMVVKNTDGSGEMLAVRNGGQLEHIKFDSNGSSTQRVQFLDRTDVVDNLTSTSTTDPLSANQGKVLNEKIPTVTMTTTDPGEGATLAANNFIGVYG